MINGILISFPMIWIITGIICLQFIAIMILYFELRESNEENNYWRKCEELKRPKYFEEEEDEIE